MITKLVSLTLVLLQTPLSKAKVTNFTGSSSFKTVTLQWEVNDIRKYRNADKYKIKFCENQIWGENFCREQLIEDKPRNNIYSTKIYGMA